MEGMPSGMESRKEEHDWATEGDRRMGPIEYLATRLPSLKPPMHKAPNPFSILAKVNRQQWLFFLVAFFGWTWDAFDFFTVSMTVRPLAGTFNVSTYDITWGITLVLMLRSVGAIIFGIASDRYGRKWPFVINNVLFIVLELATAFCQTYKQFLAVRALFGIAMGGLYGNAAATALEDCPPEARGMLSGLLQEGYAFGCLLATAFARALVNTTSYGWRPYYWFAACPPAIIIIFRLCLPETQAHQRRMQARKKGDKGLTTSFVAEGKVVLRQHWLLLTYLVLFMAGFNFMSHGSQDLYPTLLENQFGFSPDDITITQCIAYMGGMTGGVVVGYLSQVFGRRLTIIVISIIGGALLYPYTYVSSKGIIAAAFFEQFCVQGAWGIIPIHLMELSPGAFRTFIVGTSYQLGNLVSSASSTIEAKLGENFPLPSRDDGVKRYQYGKVICIFMACVYIYVVILTFFGPERLGRDFDDTPESDTAEAAGTRGMLAVDGDEAEKGHVPTRAVS
ncbi:hypothetical protein AJ80_06828 [Polytolypa hystricis UAMH7299]|uniref:Major facilitator superfamily (MFS) profile domain-containing protein n=1 Tax=Polytolypa hystricis (strain UAMH7299) TaxID=1447883 RepID=A0A2B7XUE6_POLH7|nr:hypothetical protein AJ80_06828 [Polytolypa hystricis UAMH7299]